ncbi:hypothetical protein AVEN_162352-1 [Araneus ventricosus]|uniref:Uncharacterized protein n=1 Tax=Araneus ventricosus TaxID=182803 RepID=A0A4Y2N503_ARAVE|nr:hypothetical protein AVEN_162352-1 [Araneus ventricosus]
MLNERCLICFEVKSLCKVFDSDPVIFQNVRKEIHISKLPKKKEYFVTVFDLFAPPLVQNSHFREWYFKVANPLLQTFVSKIEKYRRERSFQNLANLIRKTENALSEKNDTLKRQNIKPIDRPPIPLMDLSKYGAYLPFGEKCVHFLVDVSDYTWFKISSLCEAYNVKPDIFECKTEIFYLTDSPNDEKYFENEIDIFLTPLVDKSEFTDWYSNYAVPRIKLINRE